MDPLLRSEALRGFWTHETVWLIVGGLLLAAWLAWRRPAERSSYRNTLLLLLVGLAGGLAILYFGPSRGAAVLHTLFAIVAWAAVIRLAGFALFRLVLPAVGLAAPRIAEDLATSGAYLLIAIVQLRAAGVDLSGILATSAVITAVLAFAMQDTLGNVLGGVALQLDRSIRVGDWIRIDDLVGRITDIRWRSTSVETRNWETVVVPNSVLMKSKVIILGERDDEPVQLRRWIYFTIDPNVPPARVISIAETAVKETEIPNVARRPSPSCVLLDFEQGNLRYGLRYWLTDLALDDPTDSAVRVHLFTAFQRAGVRISQPQQTVHLVKENESHAAAVRKREIDRRLHAVEGVDLFAALRAEDRQAIAERLQYAPFARGDVITRQGNISHWLYIVTSGDAEVIHEGSDGGRRHVGDVHAGGFFGEMGMLTGEPRRATVVAKSDIECYRLDHASFRDLLQTRPQIAEEISRVVSARQPELQQVVESEHTSVPPPAPHRELVEKIRRFFGLKG